MYNFIRRIIKTRTIFNVERSFGVEKLDSGAINFSRIATRLTLEFTPGALWFGVNWDYRRTGWSWDLKRKFQIHNSLLQADIAVVPFLVFRLLVVSNTKH